MSDDYKVSVTKLIADGSNWVTYRDRMILAVGSRNLGPHLTEPTITAAYTAAGNVGTPPLTPQQRWDLDQLVTTSTLIIFFSTLFITCTPTSRSYDWRPFTSCLFLFTLVCDPLFL